MPSMMNWIDRIYFSVQHDCDMSRISGFDDHQMEHWKLIPIGKVDGKTYRERRQEVIEQLMESIEAGDPYGEMK